MLNRSARFLAESSKALPFNTKAHRKWGKHAQWIHGEGPYASLCYCPSYSYNCGRGDCLTIQLYETLDEALRAQFNLNCGSKCQDNPANLSDWHQIWDLSSRGYRRLDKSAFPAPSAQDQQVATQERLERALPSVSVESDGGAQ